MEWPEERCTEWVAMACNRKGMFVWTTEELNQRSSALPPTGWKGALPEDVACCFHVCFIYNLD